MIANPASQPAPLDPKTLVLPDNASLFTRLRLALKILKVIRGNEGNPAYGQALNACLDYNVYESLIQELRRGEDGRRMFITTARSPQPLGSSPVTAWKHGDRGHRARAHRPLDRLPPGLP